MSFFNHHLLWPAKRFDEVLEIRKGNIDPRNTPTEVFELFSIPAFDTGSGPEMQLGRAIGSSKTTVETGDCLFSKLNPRIPRTWVVPPSNGNRQICSTEFWPIHSRYSRDHDNYLCPHFLKWLFRFEIFLDEFRGNVSGGVQSRQRLQQDDILAAIVPTPTIDEQLRIVARIEELTRHVEEARKLAAAREAELDSLLQALYNRMIEGADWKPLKEVASLVRRAVQTKPDGHYEEMGIRSFGKGTFQKPVLTGKQIGNKRIYTIHEGDLVFNNVFAWEQAIAVAKPEDHGRVGSHRFITYVPHDGQATSEFLCHHFLGERGIEDIRAASPGSAGRNRTLGLTKLERILVPVPAFDEQKRFAEIAKRRQLIRCEMAGIEGELKVFNAALLAKAFRGDL
jgi:type I restriction enzyme S subunit